MAELTMKCDGTDPINVPQWEPVIGEKTLEDGGRVGDLLTITRVHLEDAKEKGELREEDSGTAYATAIMESMKNAIAFELGYPKAQFEICYMKAQIAKLECDCRNDTIRTASQVELNNAQIDKLICDCKNDTLMTDSKVSLNAAQENKLACDCCNTSAMTAADIEYRMQQIEKLICDCNNSTLISGTQATLYTRQAEGFDDNANQKLYDSQLQAWSMVFADTNLETVTPSITSPHISDSYNRLSSRLNSTFNAPCEDYQTDEDGNILNPPPPGACQTP